MIACPKLCHTKISRGKKSKQEHNCSDESEKMHGPLAELRNEHNGEKIEKAVHKPFPSKLSNAIFACTVLNNLLTDFIEAGPSCNYRYVAVHLTIDFNMFDHLMTICFQPTI